MSKLPALENAITYIVKKMEDLSAKELLTQAEIRARYKEIELLFTITNKKERILKQ